ncbi:DUF2690 domain-containing protein [Microbacterium sp. NPDC056044]|uniref:DUF2690 domain-containing protein n=1 Tax=Microbacterium sp. NPDC056044 TaxID=3345690 RepID=UPI0035DD696B
MEKFAADLRRLRLDADNPTQARLQAETGISRSVLSDAFAGRQLPSARTVDGIVRACNGDIDVWLSRRDALAGMSRDSQVDAVAKSTGKPRVSVTRGTAIAIGVGAFVIGVIASAATTLAVSPLLAPPAAVAEEGPAIHVSTGEDPAATECVEDARVATGDTRADNSLLEIVWSDKCQAGWGRITRYDGLYQGNTVTIAIYPETAADGPDRQEATEHDVQGAYTTLVVRPSADTLLCAEGSYTVDGKRIDLGDPLCI